VHDGGVVGGDALIGPGGEASRGAVAVEEGMDGGAGEGVVEAVVVVVAVKVDEDFGADGVAESGDESGDELVEGLGFDEDEAIALGEDEDDGFTPEDVVGGGDVEAVGEEGVEPIELEGPLGEVIARGVGVAKEEVGFDGLEEEPGALQGVGGVGADGLEGIASLLWIERGPGVGGPID